MDLKDVMEIIPDNTKEEIYKDVLKPTVVEAGKGLALIPRIVNGCLANVEMWCMNREFMVKKLKVELERRLEEIDQDNVVNANSRIFVSSAQAISSCWDEESIRNMYLNLMVADMNANTKEQVHPGFIEIIRQMDTLDVKLFTMIYSMDILPICNIRNGNNVNGYILIYEYMLPDEFLVLADSKKLVKSLNNLERLNLIEIDMNASYTHDEHYLGIENSVAFIELQKLLGDEFNCVKGCINKNTFGTDFFNICCNNI